MKTLIHTIIFSLCFCLALKGQSQTNWHNIGPGAGSDLHVLTFQPDNADIIYAAGDIEGIFKSTDFGKTWKNINNNLAQTLFGGSVYMTNDIIFEPNNPETVYLCNGVGLFKSTNGGDEWIELFAEAIEEEPVTVSTIAIDPNNTEIIFMGFGDKADGGFADFMPFPDNDTKSGLMKSSDGGQNWEEVNVGMPESATTHSILFMESNPDIILLTTTKGVYKSTDSGISWSESNNGLPHTNCHIMKSIMNSDKNTLFLTVKTLGTIGEASSFSGGFFRSDDLGDSWVDITGNLPRYSEDDELFNDYWKFDINPEVPEIVYLGSTRGSSYEETGIFISNNVNVDNTEWTHLYYPDLGAWLEDSWFGDPYVFDVRIAPTDTSRMAMCTDGVILSRDGGRTWEQSYSDKKGDAWQGRGLELMNTDCIAYHQSNPDILYIGYDDMGLFRSEDGGQSFIRLDSHQDPIIDDLEDIDGVKDIEVDPENGDLYISRWQGSQGGLNANFTAGGIAFSPDMGNTVSSISSGLPRGRCDLVLDKNSGESGSRILYTAVYHYGVYKSINSGQTWKAINEGLGENSTYAWEIVIAPNNSEVLYLGLNFFGENKKGLYKSIDGGANWKVLENYPEGDILSVFVDKSGDIYASMTDNFDWSSFGGLYKSLDGGDSWVKILNNQRIVDIQVNPLSEDVIIAAGQQWYNISTELQGIYLSKDGGVNWENLTTTIGHTFFNFARFHPLKPNYIITGTAGAGLWVSDSLDFEFTNVEDANVASGIEVFPNPFTDKINIELTINEAAIVKITIYNTLGERINILSEGFKGIGSYSFVFESGNLPQGIYYYTVQIGERIESRKLLLVK